jgi:hypothetical protein
MRVRFHIEPTFINEDMMDLTKLNALSTDTLRDMNHHICSLLRQRATQAQFEAGNRLRVGQKVTFKGKGRLVTAIVDKINVKTANVTEVDASGRRLLMTWRVSPSLLTPVAAPAAAPVAPKGSDRPNTVAKGASW